MKFLIPCWSKILKVNNIRDKCPQKEKEKMRHPLAFHAEGKKVMGNERFRE